MPEKRKIWANAYLCEKFCVGFQKTSRYEGINAFVNKFSRVYTKEEFSDVKKEIEKAGVVNLVRKEGFGQCNIGRKNGYPCRHMLFVMKVEHLAEIPEPFVLKGWRLDGKSLDKYLENWDESSERGYLPRHGALYSTSQWLFFLVTHNLAMFHKAMDGIVSLCEMLKANYKFCTSENGIKDAKGVVKESLRNQKEHQR
ncbi:hypothetical protein AHAS_Ahas05G0082400 [Arachis hypogaea]